MVCRSTPGNSALTTFARLHSGVDDVQVLSMFHEQRNSAPANAAAPSAGEHVAFLRQARRRVLNDHSLSPARQASIASRLARAEAQPPDARTYYAWRTIEERAVRARSAMDAHFAEIAARRGLRPQQVAAAFQALADSNRAAGRSAPRPPASLAYDPAGVPADRATRQALDSLYRHGTVRPGSDPASSDAPADQCAQCGQFAASGHTCTPPQPADLAAPSAGSSAGDGSAHPRTEGEGATCPRCDGQWGRDETCSRCTDEDGNARPMPADLAAPAAPRQRTGIRSYRDEHSTVQMTNLSQVRADLRSATAAHLRQVTVTLHDPDGTGTGATATVSGRVAIDNTGRRRSSSRDRYEVAEAGERSLRCTCPQYQATYDCPHLHLAREQVQARLNQRQPVATAPAQAVEQVRSSLHQDYQDSLAAQQSGRETFAAADDQVSYSQDMDAFQAVWDQARARQEAGDHRLPYQMQDATGGLGAREGGRSFGVEIEIDFPDDMTYTARQRVARELHEAGLSQHEQVLGWHHFGRGRRGGDYTDAPNNWTVQFDRSVDDVGGQRGCEIVSPILYDEPQTWQNLQKVCEIVERNGGRATPRTGLHVNVGAGDFNHTVDNHNRLLGLSAAYEDVLVRTAHNPQAGARHRGRTYCQPNRVPAGGYRSIRQAQVSNGHRSLINLDHVPAEGAPITSSTRVEVRVFDGTTDPGRLQASIKTSLALVNAAARGVEPGIEPEPAGTHRARNARPNGRMPRLSGQDWENDTASARRLTDLLFNRQADKEQFVHAYAASTWQRAH
jgi:hypothetical protein